ncbi:MAG: sigma-54-dependent Fis family transcriptional regulator, partial [Hyphomicrobiales bacterium]|nr:sigma-54-dependent Fis family transcriptional regulator [Hyphomicrobiales bacterium]
ELFGHKKGSFTGASSDSQGLFQAADGGTLFLDEVAELPLHMQVKLLRAIQDGEIDPVGAAKPVRVDFRLISATNKSLLDQVKAGDFREDLYYRLNVFPIFVPPLRDRREDIPDLARMFAARFASEEGKRRIAGIGSDALRLLSRYDWPGNIRQLENAVFRAVVLCDGAELTVNEFPQIAAQFDDFEATPDRPEPASAPVDHGDDFPPVLLSPQPAAAPLYGTARTVGDDGEMRALAEIEEEVIRFALAHYRGRMTEIARRLGIGRSTLYRKLKEYGLDENAENVAAE